MPIPETQLETWSHQGSIVQSSLTYQGIKGTLESADAPYSGRSYNVFLQGSYRNDTNIYAESDVDIIINLTDCFYSDLSLLSDEEKVAHEKAFGSSNYSYFDFKRDVIEALRNSYGSDVNVGNKAIVIAANGGRRKADVLPTAQFRRYTKFNGILDAAYIEGVCFWNSKMERISNYPKQHAVNLTTRHQRTSEWLKPMVRVVKNMRKRLVSDGLIEPGLAPSYFIEGLLYNVPDIKFGDTYASSFTRIFNWIKDYADKDNLLCANEQYYLLRNGSNVCWNKPDCDKFINAVFDLWNNW